MIKKKCRSKRRTPESIGSSLIDLFRSLNQAKPQLDSQTLTMKTENGQQAKDEDKRTPHVGFGTIILVCPLAINCVLAVTGVDYTRSSDATAVSKSEGEREKERIWSDQGLTRSTIRPRLLLKHCSCLARRSTRLQRKPVTKATMLTPLIELRIRDCAARNTKVDKTRRDEWENGLIPTNNPRPKRCSYDRGITSSSLVIRVIQILHAALPRFSIVAVHAALRKSIFLTNSQEKKIAAS